MANPNLTLPAAQADATAGLKQELQALKSPPAPPDCLNDVRLFMMLFGQERQIQSLCAIPPQNVAELREKLISSEYQEFLKAWTDQDLVETADALADLIYVILGTFLAYGIPFTEVWNEVQRSNMAKLWTAEEVKGIPENNMRVGWKVRGTTLNLQEKRRFAVLDEHGKVAKPPSWAPPNLEPIITNAARWKEQEQNRADWNKTLSGKGTPEFGRANQAYEKGDTNDPS